MLVERVEKVRVRVDLILLGEQGAVGCSRRALFFLFRRVFNCHFFEHKRFYVLLLEIIDRLHVCIFNAELVFGGGIEI